MFCSSCWTLLPDEALFCWKCGRPQIPVGRTAEPEWETCEVVYTSSDSTWFGTKFHFRAKAMGPDGVYTAGRSRDFDSLFVSRYYDTKDEAYEDALEALNELILELAGDGWRAMPTRGPAWYSYRFRRRIR